MKDRVLSGAFVVHCLSSWNGWRQTDWYEVGEAFEVLDHAYLICHASRGAITKQRKCFQFLPEIGERWTEIKNVETGKTSHTVRTTETLTPAVGSSVPPKTPYLHTAAATCSGSQGHIGLFYFFIF